MGLQHSLVALGLASSTTAFRSLGAGGTNHTAAPSSNSTTKTESSVLIAATAAQTLSIIAATQDNYAAETVSSTGGLKPWPTSAALAPIELYTTTVQNYTTSSNAPCTVHILNASIEWWYPATYSHPLATLTRRWGNYSELNSYTFVPHTTTFDIVSAITTVEVCTYGYSTYFEWDWTSWECMPYTEKPTAASTAVAYRTAAPPIPSGGEIDRDDVWLYDIILEELPSMSTTFSIAPSATVTETAPTPFVHFTAYEVENGNSTETIQLNSAYAQSYWLKGIEDEATATGYIPGEFMEQIPYSACALGSLKAVVTVIIVVDLYYVNQPMFAPGIVHWESTAIGWEDEPSVGAMDQSLTNLQPMTDWELPPTMTESTKPVFTKANQNPGPVPPTQAGGGAGENNIGKSIVSPQKTVGTIGTIPVLVGPSSAVVIGSQTLKPGGPAVTIGGTPVALVPLATAIIIGGTSLPLPHNLRPGQQQTIGTLGSVPVILGPSSVVLVGTQTLQPGGAPVIVGPGTTLSLAPSATAIALGGRTSLLPLAANLPGIQRPPPVLTIGSATLIPNAATQYFLGPGQTLTPGGRVVVGGTKVSLDPSAAFVVVGSSTQRLPVGPASAELIFGGSTYTALPTNGPLEASPGNTPGKPVRPQQRPNQDVETNHWVLGSSESGPTFIISGQTLAPGGTPITVSGKVLSLAPSGSFLVIDGSTTTIAKPNTIAPAQITPPPLTIDNGIFSPLPGPGITYRIGTALLSPGGTIVVAGTTIALAADATAIVVNGVTATLALSAQPIITNPPLLTIGRHTYTAVPGTGTAFIIEGQTLTPGGTITVAGTTIVLSPQATELVYGGSGTTTSTALFPATATRTAGTSSAGANERPSESRQATPTQTREGGASQPRLSSGVLMGVIGCLAWLLG